MTLLQALVLGAVQGLTEFLPVSSSGHLILFPALLGWPEQPFVFDTTLHLGTALALLVFFYKDLISIVTSFFKDVFSKKFKVKEYGDQSKLGLKIIIATLPAGLLGVLFSDYIEATFRIPAQVALFLAFGTIILYEAEKYIKRHANTEVQPSYLKSIYIGLFQTLALLPGVSRSGSTISGGMFMGLTREAAVRFSFLLSLPIILAAGLSQLVSSLFTVQKYTVPTSPYILAVGFISSAIFGYLAVSVLMKYVKTKSLIPFVIYRLLLVVFLALYL